MLGPVLNNLKSAFISTDRVIVIVLIHIHCDTCDIYSGANLKVNFTVCMVYLSPFKTRSTVIHYGALRSSFWSHSNHSIFRTSQIEQKVYNIIYRRSVDLLEYNIALRFIISREFIQSEIPTNTLHASFEQI